MRERGGQISLQKQRGELGNNENGYGRKEQEVPQKLPTKMLVAPSKWGRRK
jgi:hypothetical protein